MDTAPDPPVRSVVIALLLKYDSRDAGILLPSLPNAPAPAMEGLSDAALTDIDRPRR
jgi:hypothetical protein